jgi:hypothetical protein
LLARLRPGAEVHVIDTMVYRPDEVVAARGRSRQHYARLGVPSMIEHYHHHDWRVFAGLPVEVRRRPAAGRDRLRRLLHLAPRSPFPWLCLTVPAPT